MAQKPAIWRPKCRKSCNLLLQIITNFVNMQVSEFSEGRVFGANFSFATFPTFSPKKCTISDTLRRWRWLSGNTAKQFGQQYSQTEWSSGTARQYSPALPSNTVQQHNPSNGKGPTHKYVGPQPAVV